MGLSMNDLQDLQKENPDNDDLKKFLQDNFDKFPMANQDPYTDSSETNGFKNKGKDNSEKESDGKPIDGKDYN
jgi:hypothetical protein